MRIYGNEVLYSASDLVNFTQCEHCTTMDIINLETPMGKAADSEEMEFIQNRGYDHEHDYVKRLKSKVKSIVEIDTRDCGKDIGILDAAVVATVAAMKEGADIIYQAVLRDGRYYGYADFLRRVEKSSSLGTYSYEVVDTKLARTAKPSYIIQLCFYSEILARLQDREPEIMSLVLGDKRDEHFRYSDFSKYFASIKRRFEDKVDNDDRSTYPEPCGFCGMCIWRDLCAERWEEDDHLCQVANITKIQINKLRDAGVSTLEALACLPEDAQIPKINPDTLKKIRHQASLQLKKLQTGEDSCEVLPPDPEGVRGFYRLPQPDDGDLFFDMEGDPFEPGGLEYLFGVYFKSGKTYKFTPFWGHERSEEKKAFEAFMDFVTGHLKKHPNAYIYHYASYEETALKRLMCLHGTREAEVDNLLRKRKLVDLYKLVREGIRVSEPSYSIKNLEVFYMPGSREGEVKNAMSSVVAYERWRQEKDPELLRQIADYNEDDCRSMYLLREWLMELRPAKVAWFNAGEGKPGKDPVDTLTDAEKVLLPYREALIDLLPENREDWKPQHFLNELVYYLVDFHRREDKPEYWELFTRCEMTDEEAVEDPECLGTLTIDEENPPFQDRRSYVYTYKIPDQDSKIRTGSRCMRLGVESRDPLNCIEVNDDYSKVSFRYSMNRPPLPEVISIGPAGPINNQVMRDAVQRFADSYIACDDRYSAVKCLLRRELPSIGSHNKGDAIISGSGDVLEQIKRQIGNLQKSCISIQGPPGSGKTYTGAHIITDLIEKGFSVGVTSNSHKAINNLLIKVEEVAREKNVEFTGAKKSNAAIDETLLRGNKIQDVYDYTGIENGRFQLVAGTGWLFSRPAMDGKLDYLIVDEAGQVSLGNLVAMGTSAKNIVLLGDQMQLGQPLQGVHPGESGLSCLEFLLQGKSTVQEDMGVFLGTTWRMHPDICRFISDAVYDSRLVSEPGNEKQELILTSGCHQMLKPAGVVYLPVEHDGCSQSSEEEAMAVKEIYDSLLVQHYADKSGDTHEITAENILVVAPYNMQVNLLKRILPDNARVGTVDKFQGQEAEVVIVSMATSSEEYLPRFIEFLYSKNRLNVSLSRARCLSILVANPKLMAIKCNGIEQMKLVNTLCWVRECFCD